MLIQIKQRQIDEKSNKNILISYVRYDTPNSVKTLYLAINKNRRAQ